MGVVSLGWGGMNPISMQDTAYTDGTVFASEKRDALSLDFWSARVIRRAPEWTAPLENPLAAKQEPHGMPHQDGSDRVEVDDGRTVST